MKRFLVLSGLLFSASPALADDVLFLECKTTTRAVFTEIKTQKLIKEETKEETLFLKIDLANNRFMSHKDSQWDEAEMTGRSLKANLNKNENGLSLNGTLEIEINPPGQLSSEIDFIAWMIATKVNMNGHCNAANQSVFDAAK